MKQEFNTPFGATIFREKYALTQAESWRQRAITIVEWVCGTMDNSRERPLLSKDEREYLVECITNFKFLPGGRYMYYAGRKANYWNNCFTLRATEDTREEWSNLLWRSMSCLMTGGGIGVDYSRLRPSGRLLGRTGGRASGPIPLMNCVNEVGRNVMQGGARRSAMYASLHHSHEDVWEFLHAKNWSDVIRTQKEDDFNFPGALDMTNISVNYDDSAPVVVSDNDPDSVFLSPSYPVFLENVKQALMTGEPGFSFNFGDQINATLRNACGEFISEDDSDVCNLGSINLGAVETLDEFKDIVSVAAKFLVCGTVRADLPYEKVYQVREKNRRLGLGLMGTHEWLLKRNYKYEVNDELREWLEVYQQVSKLSADEHCNRLYLNTPVAYRAIAPTGSIGILAGTTTGIEPLYAVAYKRRYFSDGSRWKYTYVIDNTARRMIEEYGVDPDSIETAMDLAKDPERRIKLQAEVQEYVDMGISSTINLPAWGSKDNNEATVDVFAGILGRYAHRLRGFTCYPDGSRGGQPVTAVPYADALGKTNMTYEEHDVCDITGHGGSCGV